jgi:polyhydroxyalkanoate synthesis regulator phasin
MANPVIDFKRIFLAGVGAVALTAEKSRELVNELVAKGEMTVEQGKVINEELKRDVGCKVRNVVDSVIPPEEVPVTRKMESMSPEELAAIKAKLAELEAETEQEEQGE